MSLPVYKMIKKHIVFCSCNWTERVAAAEVMDFKDSRVQDAQRAIICKLNPAVEITRNSLEDRPKHMIFQCNPTMQIAMKFSYNSESAMAT